jgi:hypothetical protein
MSAFLRRPPPPRICAAKPDSCARRATAPTPSPTARFDAVEAQFNSQRVVQPAPASPGRGAARSLGASSRGFLAGPTGHVPIDRNLNPEAARRCSRLYAALAADSSFASTETADDRRRNWRNYRSASPRKRQAELKARPVPPPQAEETRMLPSTSAPLDRRSARRLLSRSSWAPSEQHMGRGRGAQELGRATEAQRALVSAQPANAAALTDLGNLVDRRPEPAGRRGLLPGPELTRAPALISTGRSLQSRSRGRRAARVRRVAARTQTRLGVLPDRRAHERPASFRRCAYARAFSTIRDCAS